MAERDGSFESVPLDMLVVGGLTVLVLDVIVGPVVADLKYLTRKEIRLPLSRARVSLAKARPDISR